LEQDSWEDGLGVLKGWGTLMHNSSLFPATLFLSVVLGLARCEAVDDGESNRPLLLKGTWNVHVAPFLINHVFAYYHNDGQGSYNPYTGNSGFEFPKGNDSSRGFAVTRALVFGEGILWGGVHRGILKVGGSHYNSGLQAGRILAAGNSSGEPLADRPDLPANRVYRVRRDISPQTPFPAVDAVIRDEELALIARYTATTAQQIYDQYVADWKEWPATDGAPFEDRNGNGVYDWAADIPGRPGADQTLWYVANDLDSARVAKATGSRPVGIEMQRTIWGYRNAGWLDNVIFQGTTLINKSGAPIDSMFIAERADPDLGESGDDFVGCDTTLHLGYAYNAHEYDPVYGYSTPAFGAVLLQGPRVTSPGDTAIMFGQRYAGYGNRRIYAFPLMMKSHSIYGDPLPTSPEQWYLDMNGYAARTGEPFSDPSTGTTTKICFAGDPVTGQGWIDGQPQFSPGDRRFMISTGPFSMADGDTQEVILAHVGAQGEDRLSSVSLLRAYAEETHALYQRMFQSIPPGVSTVVTYPTTAEATVAVTADCHREAYAAVSAVLSSPAGGTVREFSLYDDGSHGDAAAGDGVFANSTVIPRQHFPLSMRVKASSTRGQSFMFNPLEDGIVTAGPVRIVMPVVFSDNLNSDGTVNPWEDVRYGVTVTNETPFTLRGITLRQMGLRGESSIATMDSLPAGGSHVLRYDPSDAGTYLAFRSAYYNPKGVEALPLQVGDNAGNVWRDTVSFSTQSFVFPPQRDTLLHVRGTATGNLELLIVEPSRFRGHSYSVVGVDSINGRGEPGFSLFDRTSGAKLLTNHPLPDSLGHTVPITDGFKVLRGSTVTRSGRMAYFLVQNGNPNWTTTNVTNVLGLEGFYGGIGNATEHWPSGGTGYKRQNSVLFRFAPTDSLGVPLRGTPYDTLASFAYRYLQNADQPPAKPDFVPFIKNRTGNFAYQGYSQSLPFAAYDVESTPPRRLMVGHLENNTMNGTVDGRYWPPFFSDANNGVESGPREWFFVFDVPYSPTPDPSLAVDISSVHVPLMWVGYPSRFLTRGFSPLVQNKYRVDAGQIESPRAPGSEDEWSITLRREEFLPANYALSQNYPNPFNPKTTIRYTLAYPGDVSLSVFNILGQQVRTLVRGVQYAGEYSVSWDGRNDGAMLVASGVYIYRLDARPMNGTGGSTMLAKRMILLR
jgi:hypothetical protein